MPERKKEIEYKAVAGVITFSLGLVIAVILGILPELLSRGHTILLLGILGIIAGIINVTSEEVDRYLLAGLAFLVAGSGLIALVRELPVGGLNLALVYIIQNIVAFVAPAIGIIGLKVIYDVAKSK